MPLSFKQRVREGNLRCSFAAKVITACEKCGVMLWLEKRSLIAVSFGYSQTCGRGLQILLALKLWTIAGLEPRGENVQGGNFMQSSARAAPSLQMW